MASPAGVCVITTSLKENEQRRKGMSKRHTEFMQECLAIWSTLSGTCTAGRGCSHSIFAHRAR